MTKIMKIGCLSRDSLNKKELVFYLKNIVSLIRIGD